MLHLSRKYLYAKRYEFLMIALVIVAMAGRILLIAGHWPVTNSDEGNMGVLARHVAYNGEWPIFFYGLPYMGPVQGYVAALLFRFLGASLTTLRLALIPFYVGFLVGMYFLTRLLYTRRLALAMTLLFSLGSDELFSRELKAVGEYPEMMACTAWICLLVAWLVLTSAPPLEAEQRATRRRILVYALLGLITGLAIWVDLIILPFVAMSGVLLLLVCRRELRSRAGLALLTGFILGMMPLIIYNVTAPIDRNSINVLLDIYNAHQPLASNGAWLWLQQISGTVTISLPLATGFNPLCSIQAMPFFGPVNGQCLVLQGGWGLGYLVLLGLALWLAGRVYWRIWAPVRKRPWWKTPDWTLEQRQSALLQGSRLLLLIGTALTLISYAKSPSAAVYPTTSARYLTCVLVATPAILWPLWHGLRLELPGTVLAAKIGAAWRLRGGLVLRLACLTLIAGMFVMGAVRTIQEVPTAEHAYQEEGALIEKLLSLGATRIYSEYWTCNRLIFHSGERLICAALDEKLNTGFNRYTPYEEIVQRSANPAYVFPLGSAQAQAFAERVGSTSKMYQKIEQYGYVMYIPPENSPMH